MYIFITSSSVNLVVKIHFIVQKIGTTMYYVQIKFFL